MVSCEKKGNGTIEVVLTFDREQLLYDIENGSYIEGSVLESENGHIRHMIQDVGQDGNVDRVTRVLDVAVAECREMLYPYTKREITSGQFNDRLKERKVYGVVMNVPEDFSQTTLTLLERLIHEYMVSKAIADWMSITNPGKEATWIRKAEEAKVELKHSLNNRRKRVRLRRTPFP